MTGRTQSIAFAVTKEIWDFVGHKHAEVRVERAPGVIHSEFADSAEDLHRILEHWNGRGQLWIGINERRRGGTKDEDVIVVRNYVLDIEPRKLGKGEYPTEEQPQKCLDVVNRIIAWAGDDGKIDPPSAVVSSGKGFHVWGNLEDIKVGDENREEIKAKYRKFYDLMREKFETDDVKIDMTSDLSRVMGIPYTVNVRWARVRKPGAPLVRKPSHKTKEFISVLEPKGTPTEKPTIAAFKSITEDCLPPELRECYLNPSKVEDHSLILFRTLLHLANELWFSKEACAQAMPYFIEKIGCQRWRAGLKHGIVEQQYESALREGKIKSPHRFPVMLDGREIGHLAFKRKSGQLLLAIFDADGNMIHPMTKYSDGFWRTHSSREMLRKSVREAFSKKGHKLTPKETNAIVTDFSIWLDERGGSQVNDVKKKEHAPDKFRGLSAIHPSGGISDDFVYEPLGHGLYMWATPVKPGLSSAEFRHDEEKARGRWTIEVNGREVEFAGKPILTEVPWVSPDFRVIESWLAGEYNPKLPQEVWNRLLTYLAVFFDHTNPSDVYVRALGIFQSWFKELLEAVFNIDVSGAFGAGKSTALEIDCHVSYHGLLGSSVSDASIARVAEKYGVTWYFDEFDAGQRNLEDMQKYMIVRSGQRRGAKYIRWNMEKDDVELVTPFGPKAYSAHGELERALRTRGFHITVTETRDKRLPVINLARWQYAVSLVTDLLFLRFGVLLTHLAGKGKEPKLPKLPEFQTQGVENAGHISRFRDDLYQSLTEGFTQEELNLLKKLKGRNVELAYVALFVSKLIGVDIVQQLARAFRHKIEVETLEISTLSILREILVNKLTEQEAKRKEQTTLDELTEPPFVLQANVHRELNEELKKLGVEKASAHEFKKLLLELGFRDGKTIKKRTKEPNKGARILLFDRYVKERLGIRGKTYMSGLKNSQESKKSGNFGNSATRLCGFCGHEIAGTVHYALNGTPLCESCTRNYRGDL